MTFINICTNIHSCSLLANKLNEKFPLNCWGSKCSDLWIKKTQNTKFHTKKPPDANFLTNNLWVATLIYEKCLLFNPDYRIQTAVFMQSINLIKSSFVPSAPKWTLSHMAGIRSMCTCWCSWPFMACEEAFSQQKAHPQTLHVYTCFIFLDWKAVLFQSYHSAQCQTSQHRYRYEKQMPHSCKNRHHHLINLT